MFKRGMKARYVRIVLRARALRAPMKLFKWRKSSKKDYDLVSDDEYDPRIPLHPDEAFQYGITFRAKYIGTMDVPRPSSRVEIVAAMRRVRYEFKAQSVKKRKVTLDISTNGVRVTLRTKKQRKTRKFFSRKRKSSTARETVELFHHPIYRIFYVSHDSSDLKIFSYIARDGSTNDFKCNVFKSSRKCQAMKIVRTVGQAFEVCHKMQSNSPWEPVPSTSSAPEQRPPPAPAKALTYNCGSSGSGGASSSGAGGASSSGAGGAQPARAGRKQEGPNHLDVLPPPKKEGKRARATAEPAGAPAAPVAPGAPGAPGAPCPPDLPECVGAVEVEVPLAPDVEEAAPLSARHQLKLLREKLQLQTQHTRVAVSQLQLVREQLAAEQAARCDAQTRTHQLLLHNKELLEHIATLVAQLEQRESEHLRPISAHNLTLLPQLSSSAKIDRWFSLLPAPSRPESGFVSGQNESTSLTETKKVFVQVGATKKKKRFMPLRFIRKIVVNEHTSL